MLRFCLFLLLVAAGLHLFRMLKVLDFEDQREAARWGSDISCAQASAFLPAENALKQDDVLELEYKIKMMNNPKAAEQAETPAAEAEPAAETEAPAEA